MSDETLQDKAFNIAKNLKYNGYQRWLTNTLGIKLLLLKLISSKDLAEELHKPIISKLKKRKVHSPFIDNIWRVGLGNMQFINKFNKKCRFLLCVIDIFSNYA